MYKLIGKDGKEYLSEQKGQFGGYRKLKIYSKLDCPSALRHIAAGYYVQHRVFFANEETALAAGYWPCGKEHYNFWRGGKRTPLWYNKDKSDKPLRHSGLNGLPLFFFY